MATKRTASEILAEQHWKRRIVSVENANNREESQNLASKDILDNNNSNSAINNCQDALLRMHTNKVGTGESEANVQTYVIEHPHTYNETCDVNYADANHKQDQGSNQVSATNKDEEQSEVVISQNWEVTNQETKGCVEGPSKNGNENYIIVNNQEGEAMIIPPEGYVLVETPSIATYPHVEGSARDHAEQSQCLSPADHCHQVAGIQAGLVRPMQESEGTEQAIEQKIQYPEQNPPETYQNVIPGHVDEDGQIAIYQSSFPSQTQDTVAHFQGLPEGHSQDIENSDTAGKDTAPQGSCQRESPTDEEHQTTNHTLTVYANETTESTIVGFPGITPSISTDSTTVHPGFIAEKSLVDQVHFSGYPSVPVPASVGHNNIEYSDRASQELNQQSQCVEPNTDHQHQAHFYQGQVRTFDDYTPMHGYQNVGNSYQNSSVNTPNANETQSQSDQHLTREISYPISTSTYAEHQHVHSGQPDGNVDQQTNVLKHANDNSTPYYGSQEGTESHSQSIQVVSVPMQNYGVQPSEQHSVLPQQTTPQNPSLQQNSPTAQVAPIQYEQQQNVQAVPASTPGVPTANQLQGPAASQAGTVQATYRKNDTVYPNIPTVPNNAQYPEVIEHLFNNACYMPGGLTDPNYQRPLPELHHSDVASIENSKDSFFPITPTGPHPNFCTRPPYSPLGMQPQYWPPAHHGTPICSAKPYGPRNYRHSPYPFPPCHCNASHSPAPHCRGYHNGHSHMNPVSRHRRSYNSPYGEYGHGDPKRSSHRNSSCCHTPHGDSDCSMFSSDNCHTPSPASGRSRSAIRGRPSGDFSVEGAQFHSRMMRSSGRDSYSSSSDSDDNTFSSAQPGLGGKQESARKPVKNSLSDPNNPVLSSLPGAGLQRTKFLVSTYIDYLVEENERVTDMSKAFTPPTYLFLEEEEYVLNAHKEDAPFPSHGFSKFIKEYFPQVDAISVPENKSKGNPSNINGLNLSEKTFDEFAHTVFFGCQDMIEKSKRTPVNTLPHNDTPIKIPTAVAGN